MSSVLALLRSSASADGPFLPELIYDSLCDLANEDVLSANELSRQQHGHVCLGIELDEQMICSPTGELPDAKRRRRLLLWAQVTLVSMFELLCASPAEASRRTSRDRKRNFQVSKSI